MNRRKELTLQRLSKLDEFELESNSITEVTFKEKPVGAMTIEAAMGMYMCVLNHGHVEIARQGKFLVNAKGSKSETGNSSENNILHVTENTTKMYDKLDANRSAGFLLYSYNKDGMHSTLAEYNCIYIV